MYVIQICSIEEWEATKRLMNPKEVLSYPYGQYFEANIEKQNCVFYHSGETKTISAGACQYAIDHWSPSIVIVLGTCGGVNENLQPLDVIIAEKTAQYDVVPMKKRESIFHDIITIDNSWINLDEFLYPLLRGFIATADQSVTANNYHILKKENAMAADWETAAIAKICSTNRVQCCVVRSVSDLPQQGESDVDLQYQDYVRNTTIIMEKLITSYLPCIILNHQMISGKKSHL
jgi:adenosylhomocysteine nucleosidase